MASLTTLTQTVDDANNLTQDLHHLESQPNLDQFYGNNSLLTAEVDLDKDHDLVIGKDSKKLDIALRTVFLMLSLTVLNS